MARTISALLTAVVLMFGLVGCTSTASAPVKVAQDTIVVDVRTPQEYSEGHLEGAVLLDLTGGQLAAKLPTLDRDAGYLVYCRSGNRSAQASTMMKNAGISDVTDLGSMERAAEATNLPVVR